MRRWLLVALVALPILASSAIQLPAARAGGRTAELVRVIDTSSWSPPSPDPSGLAFRPSSGRLLVPDGEVDETSRFRGVNLFEASTAGGLASTYDLTSFSTEPTDVAVIPNNGRWLFVDDFKDRVFQVSLGADGAYGTADDSRTTLFRTGPFGSTDPEGLAFGAGSIFVSDGTDTEVYRVDKGPNGRYDAVPPDGDDVVKSFDTLSAGMRDPEDVDYDVANGHLYVVSRRDKAIAEMTLTGGLVQLFDVSGTGLQGGAGVAIVPQTDPGTTRLFVSDRGTDNDTDPGENDGKIFEYRLVSSAANQAPTLTNPGPQTSNEGGAVNLQLVASDADGDPIRYAATGLPSGLTINTSTGLISGRIAVGAAAGSPYAVQVSATDGSLTDSKSFTWTIASGSGSSTLNRAVSTSSDDAEESSAGAVDLASSDLELVNDGTEQTVGLRFTNISVPRQATIVNAFVQFTVDEATSGTTSLTVRGQAADNPTTFTTATTNISSRPRTTASVAWTPPAWPTVGAAGPDQRTPNLKAIVQEIVNRSGWASGNALAMILRGTGRRTAEAFNGTAAPVLYVEYRTGA